MKKDKNMSPILQVLREVDVALYELWRMLPVDSPYSRAVSALQKDYVHPNIQHVREAESKKP